MPSVRGESSPLTAELIESLQKRERAQLTIGLLPSIPNGYVDIRKKIKASSVSLEERRAAWNKVPVEQRVNGFKKAYVPQVDPWIDRYDIKPASIFYNQPAGKRFGFPLGKFPEQRFDKNNIVRKEDKDKVDYSVDECDIDWMEQMNAAQMKSGKEIFSIAIFEFWIDRLEKMCHFTPRKFRKLIGPNGEELDDVCNVCLDGECSNCNQIVYCDMCNLSVHQDCYGIPFLPECSLACRRCAHSPGRLVHCALCPSQTGAFKQWKSGSWVHVLCVLWVDETHFGNTIFMEHVQNVEKAIHDRRALSCMLCKDKKEARRGACIQCCETKCTASFHVTCARNAGLVMRVNETDDGHVNRWVWCMKHTPPETEADREQKQLMIRNARRENERNLPQINMPTIGKSDIDAIFAQSPIEDYREIVLFWFQKRRHRYGAPLLKLQTEPNENKRRRIGGQPDPRVTGLERKLRAIGGGMESARAICDLLLRREKMKKQMLTACFRLFERGFKPSELLCSQIVDTLKVKDDQNIFARPVTIPGYLKEIKHPMCLQTMTKKAERGEYYSVKLLQDDVDLMLRNCAHFNRGNKWFIDYGKKFGRLAKPILESAKKEEQERINLRNDGKFMERLLNSSTTPYTGWTNKEAVVVKVESEVSTPGKKRRRRVTTVPKIAIEDVKIEKEEEPQQPPPPPPENDQTPRRPRSRRRGAAEPKFEDLEKPSTSSSEPSGINGTSASSPAFRKRIQPFEEPPKKNLRQTSLTSFFTTTAPKVTFADVVAAAADTGGGGPSTSSSRPFTRLSTASATPRTTHSFRSNAILSPATQPRRMRYLDSTDEEEDIQIYPPPRQLSPEEIAAEKLRSAENEAFSKFAHNQLVVVEGRAAKVIEYQLAHLSDIHHEQRQSMMKKRREVLGEIPKQAAIYVEFFQKSNTLENYKWVMPDAVELLDLNNVQRSPKIPGLKAAREWHQKVLNGEDV
uniref:Uncharacterized protein n=1 Tax=Caenorhabditis japonica TaxID=281687 RepID=A0A8R1DT47_CAEJA